MTIPDKKLIAKWVGMGSLAAAVLGHQIPDVVQSGVVDLASGILGAFAMLYTIVRHNPEPGPNKT